MWWLLCSFYWFWALHAVDSDGWREAKIGARSTKVNANRFALDGGDNGREENSAGDIWLLPYWMGRYLGVISAPETNH